MFLDKNTSKLKTALHSKMKSEQFYESVIALPYTPDKSPTPETKPTPSKNQELKSKIQQNTINFFNTVLRQNNIYKVQTEWAELANIGGSKITKIKKYALREGYIKEHTLHIRNKVCIWEPLEKAYKLINLEKPRFHSIGGYLHSYCAHHIKNYYKEKSFFAEIEYKLHTGKLVDVIATKDNQKIYIEIGLSSAENELKNVEKIFQSNQHPDKLILALKNKSMLEKTKTLLHNSTLLNKYKDKLVLETVGKYITIQRKKS